MIEEDYVSFEIAKLLKEKGFDEKCFQYWHEKDNELVHSRSPHPIRNITNPCFLGPAAPTLQMAMKWLRDEHHLYVWISYNFNHTGLPWYYEIFDIKNRKVVKIGGIECGSYEKTCEIAIEECLKNLI